MLDSVSTVLMVVYCVKYYKEVLLKCFMLGEVWLLVRVSGSVMCVGITLVVTAV